MKFEGKEIEIKPLDIVQPTKTPESKRMLWLTNSHAKTLISMIKSQDESVQREALETLNKKLESIVGAKNGGLVSGLEKIMSIKGLSFSDVRERLSELLEGVKNEDLEAEKQLTEMIEGYNSYYQELYDFFSEKTPDLKKRFIARVEDFFKGAGLNIDMDKIRLIVENAKISFYDNSFESGRDKSGGHNVENNVFINLDSIDEDIDFVNTLFHELLHSISQDYSRVMFINGRAEDTQSSGVSFTGNFNNEKRGFVWLDEYFTETFTNFITESDHKGEYIKELTLVNLLGSKGPFDFVGKLSHLYFRHAEKYENKTTTPIEDWRNFSKEVDSVFGERFLVTLDIFIATHGINRAIEIIEKWENSKPRIEDLKIEKPQAIA